MKNTRVNRNSLTVILTVLLMTFILTAMTSVAFAADTRPADSTVSDEETCKLSNLCAHAVDRAGKEMETTGVTDELPSHDLGMPISIVPGEDNSEYVLLGGYTFKVAEGTEMGSLMRLLENWNNNQTSCEILTAIHRSFDYDWPCEMAAISCQNLFFSQDWIYETGKLKGNIDEGKQRIEVDVDHKTITFFVYEDIDELPAQDVLTALRASVIASTLDSAES